MYKIIYNLLHCKFNIFMTPSLPPSIPLWTARAPPVPNKSIPKMIPFQHPNLSQQITFPFSLIMTNKFFMLEIISFQMLYSYNTEKIILFLDIRITSDQYI